MGQTIPNFDLNALVDALAAKVADRVRVELGGSGATLRPRLLTIEQAGVYLSRTTAAIQHMVASGKLPTVRSDRRVFIDVEDLDRWILEHKHSGM